MRVLFLSTWFPYPPDNGSKIRAHYLLRALCQIHHVTLVGFQPDSRILSSELELHATYAVPVDPFRHVNAPNLLKYASPIPLAFWPSHTMRDQVQHLVRTQSWDAVVAIQTPVAQYATLVPAPRVIDVDTAFSYQMQQRHRRAVGLVSRARTWISWQKTHQYERRFFRQFQAHSIASEQETDFVAGLTRGIADRPQVIPNGADCAHNRPGQYPVQLNTLVYSGALTYRANYDAVKYFLAEVYPLIRQDVPDVTLTITGSTHGVDLDGLPLCDGVRLSGYVDDIRPLVAGSSVCVVPIRAGGGTRLKILEAMALGTPVVATSKAAEGIEAMSGQHLLLADDAPAFAECVVRMLRDAALRQRLAIHARQLVEQRYNWTQIGECFVKMIEETVRRKQTGTKFT